MHRHKDKLNKNCICYNNDHAFFLNSYLGSDAFGNGDIH